jgi:hypothetical protein
MNKFLHLLLFFALVMLATGCSESTNSPIVKHDSIDWEYQIAYQRGIEAMNWAVPAVSMISMREGNFSLGGGYNTIYWISKPPTALAEAITPNNQTPYASVYISTKEGPVVLDIPPASEKTAIFGSATDVWQVPVSDIGPAGMHESIRCLCWITPDSIEWSKLWRSGRVCEAYQCLFAEPD